MSFIEKYIRGKEGKWLWFIFTIIGSCLPMGIRLVVAAKANIACFDYKDLLFAGLAINLSNLNLIGSRKFEEKVSVAAFSALGIIFCCAPLMIFFMSDDNDTNTGISILKGFSIIIVILSGWFSYDANNYVIKLIEGHHA